MASQDRLLPLDWLRGSVMVLMTLDHASESFNAGRLMTDASWIWKPGTPLAADQFMLRWVTHLCAPSFVFLAGASIALSARRRQSQGQTERAIDRDLWLRGAFIALLDPLWMSLAFMRFHGILLQVLYGIGAAMLCMPLLRRLSDRTLVLGALSFFVLSEALVDLLASGTTPALRVVSALLLTSGLFSLPLAQLSKLIVAYPLLPWLAIMALGHASASMLADPARRERRLVSWGLGSLALFLLVRGLNGYGNMHLLRDSAHWVQWLHVSKYPPSLSFVTLELGLMALLLAGFFRLERLGSSAIQRALSPLALLGQSAMFYYLLHAHLLVAAAALFGLSHTGGIALACLASALTLLVLSPLCRPFLRYKRAHPEGLVRFV